MAKKANASSERVTRIKATDSSSLKKRSSKISSSPEPVKEKTKKTSTKKARRNPAKAFFGYFKGAWQELKQVRWPNRAATWSLTGAVLAFTAFFAVLILLLDALFKYVFELILG